MGILSDALREIAPTDTTPSKDTVGESFSKGLRSGALGAGSQLTALAGGVAEALGANEFAKARYAGARDLSSQAQAAAPQLTDWRDVGGVGDALRYSAGMVGQSVPVTGAALGAGLLTGGSAVPAMLAGTAATAPFEIGDMVQRQQNDPVALQRSAGDRLQDAAVTGVGSAALQSVVPAIVGGKIMGKTAATAAKQSARGIVGRGLADAGLEGVTEGAGEAVKQGGMMRMNPDTQLDTDAILDNAIGGAAGGLGVGTLGMAGEVASGNAHQVKSLVGRAAGAVGDQTKSLMGRAKDAAQDVAQGAESYDLGGNASSMVGRAKETVTGMVDDAKAKVEGYDLGGAKDAVSSAAGSVAESLKGLGDKSRAFADRVANSEEFMDASRFADAQGEKLKTLIGQENMDRVARVGEWGQELMSKATDPETRAKVQAAMGDLGNKANQAVIAGTKKANDLAARGSKAVGDLASMFKEGVAAAKDGAKKSADYGGVDKVIKDAVGPYLREHAPHLLADPKNIDALAPALRNVVSEMSSGKPLSVDAYVSLLSVTGEKTVGLLDAVQGAMKDTDPAKVNTFFEGVNALGAVQKKHAALIDTMRESLRDGAHVDDDMLVDAAKGIVKWANTAPDALPARQKARESQVQAEMQRYFGSKAKKVLEAAQALVKEQATQDELAQAHNDETAGERGDLSSISTGTKMATYHGKLLLNAQDDPGKNGFQPAITQAIGKAQASNPNRKIRYASAEEMGADHPMVKAKHDELVKQGLAADLSHEEAIKYADGEIGKYGAAVSEESTMHTDLSADELESARLDTKRFSRSASRIDAGGAALDAVKLTEMMHERFKAKDRYNPTDEMGGRLRDAHMFMEAVAAVQDHVGKTFEIPDSTVISKSGLTWGEAQKLDSRTEADKASDADTQLLTQLRADYKAASARLRDAPVMVRGKAQDAILEQARGPAARKEFAVAKEQGQPDDAGREKDDVTGFEGGVERGIQGPSKKKLAQQIALTGTEIQRLTEAIAEGRGDPAELGPQLSQLTERMRSLTEGMARAQAKLEDLGTGQQEFDPFGPTFQNGRGLDTITKGRGMNSDGGETLAGAPSLLGPRKKEGSPDPKAVAAKKAAFLTKARSGDTELIEHLKTSTDAKGLQRAAEALAEDGGANGVLRTINQRIAELAADEDVAYILSTGKYSAQPTSPGATMSAAQRQEVFDHVKRVLGQSVLLDMNARIPHAGEFRRMIDQQGGVEDLIRVSVHALNPLGTAYHESLHALFAKLGDQRNGKIAGVLERAASTPEVMTRLRELLSASPEAQAQLSNAEERAAYMYQFWATGDLKLAQPAQTLFGRVAAYIRSALGIWSNDERALHILNYFHQGSFAQNLGNPSAVAKALMAPGRNKAVEKFKAMTEHLRNLGEQIAVAGHQRLRDTGIPALRELADVMKAQGTATADDPGFIPAARTQASAMKNDLAERLHGFSEVSIDAALESLQRGDTTAIAALTTPEDRANARMAVKAVRKTLDDAYEYMTKAGVKVNDLGVGKDYFPRVWDVVYISSHQKEFLAMLSNNGVTDPEAVMNWLMTSEGNEFTIEVDRPGMQHLKERSLKELPLDQAAQFQEKNLYRTMSSYLTQAARRGEWARRLGDDGAGLTELLERAEQEGATQAELDAARKYVRGVDGTLGDTINPAARRLQGNLIVYQNVRLLPLAIFSSVVDPMGIMVRGGTVGEAFEAFKRGIREIPKSFKGDAQDDAATQLAATLGVIDSAALTHTLGAAFSQGMVGDTARKINDTFFRFNLMEQFNTSMRVGATQAALGFMARHADGKASQHSVRWMAELGFAPGELRRGPDGRVLLSQADGLTEAQEGKVRMAVNRWVDGAVLRPDAADKPIWMNDPHFALIAHLKQFTYSFHETILKRAAHEAQMGNMSPAYALAGYVPVMIAADMMKGVIQGGGSEPEWKRQWTASDYLWSGVERAGLLGVGQFGVDIVRDVGEGRSGLGHLLGPTVEQLGDAAQVLGGRESMGRFVLRGMPANALYANALKGEAAESLHPE